MVQISRFHLLPIELDRSRRPEIELLLCCARPQIDSATDERIKELLLLDIDWFYLCNLSRRHRATMQMYWNLNSSYSSAVPKGILAQLRYRYRKNLLNNLFLVQELQKLLELLKQKEISAIPFKGPALALSAYGNLGLRWFSDLDILVRKEDFSRTKELLLSNGYRSLHDSKHEKMFFQAQLLRHDGLVNVDLHYGIPPQHLQLNCEYFWDDLEQISIEDGLISTFSPETHALLLCVEGYKEPQQWLGRIIDLAALIRLHQGMNWERIIAMAKGLKIDKIFYLGLLIAHKLLDIELPPEFIEMLKADPVKRGLVSKLSRQVDDLRVELFGETCSIPITPFTYSRLLDQSFYLELLDLHHLENLAVTDRLSDRIKYCTSCAMTPTTTDRDLLSLPKSMAFLYYLFRPLRLFGKFGLRLYRHYFQLSR